MQTSYVKPITIAATSNKGNKGTLHFVRLMVVKILEAEMLVFFKQFEKIWLRATEKTPIRIVNKRKKTKAALRSRTFRQLALRSLRFAVQSLRGLDRFRLEAF